MSARDPTADALTWTVYHRSGRGGRWAPVATGLTHRAAVAAIDGPGDWWLSPHRPEPVRVKHKPRPRKAVAAVLESPSLFAR